MGNEVKRCVIIAGAPEDNIEYYRDTFGGRFVIAADSGYDKCTRLGIKPDLIIGDFDSSDEPDTDCEKIVLPVRKDDTDTFYAVKEAVKRGFGDIIILGGLGARFDHTYANVLCIYYCLEHNVKCSIRDLQNDITAVNTDTVINKENYISFSLYALFEPCDGLGIKGSAYDTENIRLMPYEQFAQSNAFVSDRVEITLKSGTLMIIRSND